MELSPKMSWSPKAEILEHLEKSLGRSVVVDGGVIWGFIKLHYKWPDRVLNNGGRP